MIRVGDGKQPWLANGYKSTFDLATDGLGNLILWPTNFGAGTLPDNTATIQGDTLTLGGDIITIQGA